MFATVRAAPLLLVRPRTAVALLLLLLIILIILPRLKVEFAKIVLLLGLSYYRLATG